LIESPSSLQREAEIKLLVKFDPRHHGVSHLIIFSVNIFDHDVFTFLLLELIGSLVDSFLLPIEICLQLDHIYLTTIHLQLML